MSYKDLLSSHQAKQNNFASNKDQREAATSQLGTVFARALPGKEAGIRLTSLTLRGTFENSDTGDLERASGHIQLEDLMFWVLWERGGQQALYLLSYTADNTPLFGRSPPTPPPLGLPGPTTDDGPFPRYLVENYAGLMQALTSAHSGPFSGWLLTPYDGENKQSDRLLLLLERFLRQATGE